MKTHCSLDLTYFPYDVQKCEIMFISWVYPLADLTLTTSGPIYFQTIQAFPNGEWTLTNISGYIDKRFVNETDGIGPPMVVFALHLRRKPGYYVVNMIIPTVIMTLIAGLVFWLPSEAGEKISLGINVLLAFSVLLLLVSDNVPRTSDKMPMLCE